MEGRAKRGVPCRGRRELHMSENPESGSGEAAPTDESEQLRPVVTRREFMAGAGAGLAVGAVVAGGIAIATRPHTQTQPTAAVTAPGGPAGAVQAPAPAAGQPAQPAAPG